jgi:hypothetical protein
VQVPLALDAVIPAISRARLFTQMVWPSRFGRNTMRSGTTASRRSLVGVPPGNTSMDQPPPRIHSRSGCSSAYVFTRRR